MSSPTLPVVSGAPWDGPAGSGAHHVTRPVTVRRGRARRAVPAALFLGDAVAVLVSVLVTAWLLPGGTGIPEPAAGILLAWTVVVGVLAARGSYSKVRRQLAHRVADDLAPVAVSLGVAGLCLLSLQALVPPTGTAPIGAVGLLLATCLVTVPLCRSAALLAASAAPANVLRVVVVGTDEVAGTLLRRLRRSRLVHVVGTVDDGPAADGTVLGRIEDLPRICADRHVDRVVIAFSHRHPAWSAQVLRALQDEVEIDVVARFYELMSWESRISDVTGLSLVSVGRPPGRGSAAAKRALDVAIALAVLALCAPLLLVVAVAVRLDAGRPVLFRQTRVGRHQRPFRIVKFRTMRPAPHDATVRSPLDHAPDPDRITALGRILRRSGIDELPQLVNVLRGEMSVVGPRPFVPEESAGLEGWTQHRFDVRPGLTGMWQVCGQHELTMDELCRLDVQYATTWTIRSDLRILARTPGRLLRGSAEGR